MTDRLVKALDETWAAIRSLLAGVAGDDWQRPTPCTDWSVFDLAAHLGAIESQFQGLPQPETTVDPGAGIDAWTGAGVVARRSWSAEQVLDEIDRASAAQLERLRGLDEAGWQAETFGPVGPTTVRGLAEIRLFDIYVHLLDLRTALGLALDPDGEADACAIAVERAVTLTPWGAVKKAGLSDGDRVRLDLSGPGGVHTDLVIEGGRGALTDPQGEAAARISGTAAAYLLVASGRPDMTEAAGGLHAEGRAAEQLLAGYRMFAS